MEPFNKRILSTIPAMIKIKFKPVSGIGCVQLHVYKNPSWVWGWDRKIRPEDQRLASRGLPSDDKRWSRRMNFSILSSHE